MVNLGVALTLNNPSHFDNRSLGHKDHSFSAPKTLTLTKKIYLENVSILLKNLQFDKKRRSKAFFIHVKIFVHVKVLSRSKTFLSKQSFFCRSKAFLPYDCWSEEHSPATLGVRINSNDISILRIVIIENIQRLAKEVLAEVPNQFELYMRRRGIKPIGWNLKEISRSELTPKNTLKIQN